MPKAGKAAKVNKRFHRWTWTINVCEMAAFLDPDCTDWVRMQWDPEDFILDANRPKKLRYFICKPEVGGKTEMFHWQGYSEFKCKVSIKQVKEMFKCNWMHLEVSQGNSEDNQEYISKEDTAFGDVIEWGVPGDRCQGMRSDLDRVHDDIHEGRTLGEIADRNFGAFVRYHGGISKALQLITKRRKQAKERREVEVILNWGVPGSGKSHMAYEDAPELYNKPLGEGDAKWWDGYDGEEVILLDDFTGQIKPDELKRILDIYPYEVSVRGGMSAPLSSLL